MSAASAFNTAAIPAETRAAFFDDIAHGRENAVAETLKQYPAAANWRQERSDTTPLQWAMVKNKAQIALLLLDAKADPEDQDKDDRMTALMTWAMGYGEMPLATLVAHGGKLDSKDKDGFTPLMYAAHSGQPERAKALMDAGADPTKLNNANENAEMIALRQHAKLASVTKDERHLKTLVILQEGTKTFMQKEIRSMISEGLGTAVEASAPATFKRRPR